MSFSWDDQLEAHLLFQNYPSNISSVNIESDDAVSTRLNNLRLIKASTDNLRLRYQQEIQQKLAVKSKLQEARNTFQQRIDQIEQLDIKKRIEEYMVRKIKIQLLSLARSLQKLDQFGDVREIPGIVLGIKSNAPPAIFRNMKIHQLLKDTVTRVRAKLLNKFLQAFEDHLSEDNRNWTNNEASEESWSSFLQEARSWLLAYALVSLLPPSIMDSLQAVLETFQTAIDEAFTPLWGRFFHHLKQGREGQSVQQLFWTFSFARSFLQMLLALCVQTTSSDLKKLADLDYAQAGKEQIVEKALKFLRFHIAQLLVDCDSSNDDFAARLIEESLELDEWLSNYQPQLTLSSVLYDAKSWFHRMLWMEQRTMLAQLQEHCSDSVICYKDIFCSSEMPNYSSIQSSQLSCYQSLYHCLSMFQLCRRRYQYLPASAQYILSEVILEPILCLSLGLLLYRIRSDPVLFQVSLGQRKKVGDDKLCKEQLEAFSRCVNYYQSALDLEDDVTKMVAASSSRCKRRWGIVQNWMPKILITETQSKLGFSLKDLLKTALKTSDKFQSSSFDYRARDTDLADSSNITDCVLMVRGLAITLVEVLRQQILL
jgi:hypothetical protein